jgi:hypothetical protein
MIKWLGCGIGHPPPCSTEVKKRVELYLYSSSHITIHIALVSTLSDERTSDLTKFVAL